MSRLAKRPPLPSRKVCGREYVKRFNILRKNSSLLRCEIIIDTANLFSALQVFAPKNIHLLPVSKEVNATEVPFIAAIESFFIILTTHTLEGEI